jgi:eukaryotic translation initiation factor 2C
MTDFKDELRLQIDLDRERGIPPREGRAPNVHRVTIRKAKVVNLNVLSAYLGGQMDFDNSVLEAISKVSGPPTAEEF